jgi:hypothetical protein
MPGPAPRRFRAFCAGIPKTGTTSVGTIFEGYRSSKVAGSALERLGCDWRDGKASEEEVRAFVSRRDAEEQLEMDPSSANWMVLRVLRDQYPDAKFIVTIRDCYSWCDSMLNVVISRDIGPDFIQDPELFHRLIGCDLDWFRDEETVVRWSEAILEKLLTFWDGQARTVGDCPPARRLVVRTSEISSGLDAMADFVGVPRESMLPERSHSRITAKKFDVLQRLDRDMLRSRFAVHAGSDLMKEYFPGVTLESFLERSAKAPRRPAPAPPLPVQPSPPEPAKLSPELERAAGLREMVDALGVIRGKAAEGVPERFGHRLQGGTIEPRDGGCYLLLSFASGSRPFVFELGRREALEGHWLATERFAICYRKATPAIVQPDLQLAQTLLDAVERDVRTSGSDGGTHERDG